MHETNQEDIDISSEPVKLKPVALTAYAINFVILALALIFEVLLKPVLIFCALIMFLQLVFNRKNRQPGWIRVTVMGFIVLSGLITGIFIREIGIYTIVLCMLLIPFDIYMHNRRVRKILKN